MFGSNSPSVLGLVSIRHATSVSAFARRSSRSTPPSGLVATFTTSKPAIVTVAGLVPWAVSGVSTLWRVSPRVLVVGAREQHARELAVRARGGLQADVRQPRDLRERALEVPHQLQRALRALGVLQRVQARVARQRGDALVQAGVVLHRARPQRVEARVEVEVALGEAHVVAHDLRL